MKSSRKIKQSIRPINFVFLFFAGMINAIGVGLLLVPFKFIDGGLSGTSFMMSELTKIPMSVYLVVLNFPFYIMAAKKIGINSVIYSLYAISVYSLFIYIFKDIFKLCQTPETMIVTAPILGALFGGLLSGIGSGLTIKFGGALDGVEILSVMFHKKLNLTVGQFVMAYNLVIYIIFGFLKMQFDLPLYSIVAYAVGLKAVDMINEGLEKTIMALIVSQDIDKIAKAIDVNMKRSMTIVSAKGYYSKVKTNMIYCVVNRFEVNNLRELILSVDENAFVTFSEVSSMIGKTIKKGKATFEELPNIEEKTNFEDFSETPPPSSLGERELGDKHSSEK